MRKTTSFPVLTTIPRLSSGDTPFLERHKHLLTPGRTATEYDSTRVQLVPISLLAILTEYGERVTYRGGLRTPKQLHHRTVSPHPRRQVSFLLTTFHFLVLSDLPSSCWGQENVRAGILCESLVTLSFLSKRIVNSSIINVHLATSSLLCSVGCHGYLSKMYSLPQKEMEGVYYAWS